MNHQDQPATLKSSSPENSSLISKRFVLKMLEWLRSNLEVFAIAFVLAMTIRCFGIEVFKIPTSSMEPTLMGDIISGDRIIANKFIMLLEPIKRFDVVLFKFPLDRTKNFIKRVVGLPGEELTTRYGNIYFRKRNDAPFQLATKPLKIQESIWIPISSEETDWNISEAVKFQNDGLHLDGENNRAEIKYPHAILDQYNGKGGNYQVDDIKLRCNFRINSPRGKLIIRINTAQDSFTLSLSPEGNHFSSQNNTVALSQLKITFLRDYLLEVMNYDGMVYIKLDDQFVYQYDYSSYLSGFLEPDLKESFRSSTNPVVIEARGGKIVLWNLQLWRDIYYTLLQGSLQGQSVIIPENKYFVIGDNAANSKDSRAWQINRIKLKDGRVIECDQDSYLEYPGNRIEIIRRKREMKGGDIWGNDHIIPFDQIDQIEKGIKAPFVDYQMIFGKAFMVYWPLNRIKLIK